RRRLGVAEERIDLADGTHLIASCLPDLSEPLTQPANRLQLGTVVVAPPRPPPAVQVRIESGHIAELLALDPIAVDQPTCGSQRELGVMTENHLTHDPFPK